MRRASIGISIPPTRAVPEIREFNPASRDAGAKFVAESPSTFLLAESDLSANNTLVSSRNLPFKITAAFNVRFVPTT